MQQGMQQGCSVWPICHGAAPLGAEAGRVVQRGRAARPVPSITMLDRLADDLLDFSDLPTCSIGSPATWRSRWTASPSREIRRLSERRQLERTRHGPSLQLPFVLFERPTAFPLDKKAFVEYDITECKFGYLLAILEGRFFLV